MTEMKVSDDMLMAYADGELDAAERDSIAALAGANPAIAAKIARFARARQSVREAYAPVLSEPVPEFLIAAISRAPATGISRKPPFSLRRLAMPLAASLVVAAGLGGYFMGLSGDGGEPAGFLALATGAPVLDALAATPSGETVRVVSSDLEIDAMATGTYQVADGVCRTYQARTGGDGVRAIACTDGGPWHVPVAMMTEGQSYRPAQDAETAIIDTYLDSVAAGGDIGAEAEAGLIASGWQ